MASGDDSEFLDLLYDAAVDPSLWTPVMERLADMVGGTSGWLSQLNVIDGSGGHLNDPFSRIDPVWPQRYLDHFAERNPFARAANPIEYLRGWTTKILTHDDDVPKDTLVHTEFYNDFLKPQSIESTMMIRLARNGPEIAVMNINCAPRRGRFEQAEIDTAARLQPHLIRAFTLGRKLAQSRALDAAAGTVFDQSSHGMFLVDDTGRILRANPTGETLLTGSSGLKMVNGRLVAAEDDADAGRRLKVLIAAASPAAKSRTGGSMALPSYGSRLPLSITVTPISPERAGPYQVGPAAMVCVTDLDAEVRVSQQKLRSLFGLTQTESRLALALLEGLSLQDAATRFGVSPHTVRVQLAHAFEKTGTSRQPDLVRLMMRLADSAHGESL